MKRLLILVLLFSQVYAQKKVELPRRPGAASNTVYILDAPFKPGDTVLLSGDYLWIQIKGIKGTAEKPIVFKPKGKVTIGGYASYTLNLYGEHFKVLGGGKLVIGHPTVFAMGINLGTSHHVEIAGLEMYNVTTGIQQNPTGTELIEGCYYHDLYIHDMQNPPHKGRAEAFYIGKTSPGGCYFKDLRIENNRIENVSGDGIQVSGGTFTIRNNKVRNYGMADLEQQNNGILVGGNATAVISGNEVSGGTGPALQVLGRGVITITGNRFINNKTTRKNEDLIYINGRTEQLTVQFENNEFLNNTPGRRMITNGTPANMSKIVYRKNKVLNKVQVALLSGDAFSI